MPIDSQATAASLLLEQKKPFVITVNGHCMQPLLNLADQVAITPAAHYLPGDVLLFMHPLQGLTVHRLLGVTLSTRGLRYMTKADSSNQIDRMLKPQEVLGRVDRNLTQAVDVRPSQMIRLRCTAQLLKYTFTLVLKKLTLK
jgi:hypothetical protein